MVSVDRTLNHPNEQEETGARDPVATMVDERLVCTLESLARDPGRVPWCIRQTREMGRACFATEDIAADQTIVRPQAPPSFLGHPLFSFADKFRVG